MIDVSCKDVTVRTAKASGCIVLGEEAFDVVRQGTCIKGDVLATAKIAATQYAQIHGQGNDNHPGTVS